MKKYNEVSSLSDALAELGICKASQAVIRRKLTLEACAALGITAISTMDAPTNKGRYSKVENGEIVRWLAAKYAAPILQKKPRQYADKYAYS